MRKAVRWVCAVLSYTLVLLVVAAAAMMLAWGCHHRPIGSGGLACSEMFSRFGAVIVFGFVIAGHSLASALAVMISPTHRRIVALVAVLLPVSALSLSMRNSVSGDYDVYHDILPILLMGIPTAICTLLVVRKTERRHVA
jgi:hypothetical protein